MPLANRNSTIGAAALVLVALLQGCGSPPTTATAPSAAFASPDARTRATREPPGALNPDVTQGTIRSTICVPGWTASVRPSRGYTDGVKLKLLREAGLAPGDAARYELDHFIPLALGGHPRKLENLWLQPWEGANGARAKDRLEVSLKRLVCAGRMTLSEAQAAITAGWEVAFKRYVTSAETGDPDPD